MVDNSRHRCSRQLLMAWCRPYVNEVQSIDI
jgi:hypothetical protein